MATQFSMLDPCLLHESLVIAVYSMQSIRNLPVDESESLLYACPDFGLIWALLALAPSFDALDTAAGDQKDHSFF